LEIVYLFVCFKYRIVLELLIEWMVGKG